MSVISYHSIEIDNEDDAMFTKYLKNSQSERVYPDHSSAEARTRVPTGFNFCNIIFGQLFVGEAVGTVKRVP